MFLGLVKQITKPDKNQRNKMQYILFYRIAPCQHPEEVFNERGIGQHSSEVRPLRDPSLGKVGTPEQN